MILKKLRYKNFFSVGNDFLEIDLSKYGQALAVGKNGGGKSTSASAITYALFGKTIKNVTQKQIINSINNKNCVVELELTADTGKEYLIRRGIKPNIFEIFEDGVLIDQTAVGDYQDHLESNIIKTSFRTFLQTSIISVEKYTPFMSLPKGQRREFVEDILSINVFTVMNQLLKAKISKNKEETKLLDSNIKTAKEKILLLKAHIDKVSEIASDSLDELNEKISTYTDEIVKYEAEIDTNQAIIDKNIPIQKSLRANVEERKTISSKITGLQVALNNLNKNLSFFHDNENCPTCKQGIDTNHIETIQKSTQISKEEIEKELAQQQVLMAQFDLLDDQISEIMTQSNGAAAKISTANTTISRLNKLISATESEKTKLSVTVDLTVQKDEMRQLAKDAMSQKERLAKLSEEAEYNTLMLELLKDSGIKSKIVDQYIPVINTLVNKYIEKLDFFVSFELNSEFEETIKSRHRDVFSYESFSAGERQRIDMAMLFTFRQIAAMRNAFSCNLLLLDEMLDSSVEATGIDALMDILDGDEFASTNLFVISHANKDMYASRFDAKYEFTKHGNFTLMEETVL